MDIVTLRTLSVVFMALAFAAICWWAYGPSRREKFEAAGRSIIDDADPVTTDVTEEQRP